MTFDDRCKKIHKRLLEQDRLPHSRINKCNTIISSLIHQYKNKKFEQGFIPKEKIHQNLCYAVIENLIDVADIYVLNAFVSNLSIYKIDISHIQSNFINIAYSMVNCEIDKKIIVEK